MVINARNMHFKDLNESIRRSPDASIEIQNCCGQRYIGCGLSGKELQIYGTPGNALGAYLSGANLFVHGNGQDAAGDTMDGGSIYVDGLLGDAAGYAMRGGSIYVHGNVGYRAGIHMKAYEEKSPLLVVGGEAGSFLGEYQAGGTIIVLGLHTEKGRLPVGNFCGMGMHGGSIYLRAETLPPDFSERLLSREASEEDRSHIQPAVQELCRAFGEDFETVWNACFLVITPNSQNPYKQLYAAEQ